MRVYVFRIAVVILTMILSAMFSQSINAQYYYKDIWNTLQLNKESIKLKNEGIKQISTKSFEDDGNPSGGFFCEKKIDKDFTFSIMKSSSYITGNYVTVSYYNDGGQIIKVIDSSSSSVNETLYKYERNKIKSISTLTNSSDGTPGISEEHEYFYNASGSPERMIRRKMGTEYSIITFLTDINGNIIEENEMIKNTAGKKYFYYYDAKNRLTDVVHNSLRANRLLPDYVYEYDQHGNISQLISTEESSSNYFIWKYEYDDRNLRISEKCFSKERRLLGTIVFAYK